MPHQSKGERRLGGMAFALGQREGFLTAGNMIPGFIFEPFDLDIPPQDELPALVNLYGTDWNDDWDESDTREITDGLRGPGVPEFVCFTLEYVFLLFYVTISDLFRIIDGMKVKGLGIETRNPSNSR